MKTLALGILLVCSIVAAQEPPKHAIKTDVSANAPRYQLLISPESRRDIFLLDSYTGKIWRMRMPVDDQYFWEAEDRIDDDGQAIAWYRAHVVPKKESTPSTPAAAPTTHQPVMPVLAPQPPK
jgi:hypothetical protein